MTRPALFLLLLVLAACDPSQSDVQQLGRMEARADPAANAAEPISCNAADLVCVRLHAARGSACLQLAEARDVAARERNRACALDGFRTAARLLPGNTPVGDRRTVLIGGLEARKTARDNPTTDTVARQALNEEIRASTPALADVTGGEPYAAYYAADSTVFSALHAGGPVEACPMLQVARAALPTGPLPADLRSRVEKVRSAADAAGASPVRRCP